MNKTGRPRNTSGSLYLRRDSQRLVDELPGPKREVQTGVDRAEGKRRSREGAAQAAGRRFDPAWVTT